MRGLLIDNDAAVASWTYQKFNIYPPAINKALGILDAQGNLIGGIFFHNHNGLSDLHLSYYGVRTLSLGICRIIARTALGHFNVGRLTVITSRKNRRLIKSLMKIGFRIEGSMKCFYGHEDNKRNVGVRLVAFREQLAKVAYKTKPEKKQIEIK